MTALAEPPVRSLSEGPSGAVDFDLHGIVTVRVLDGAPVDVAMVERQLGPVRRPAAGEPDITVRLVDRLPPAQITFVGHGETGYDAERFYLLKGREGRSARTVLPFAEVGGRCTIVCERGVGAVPHLLSVVNLTALAKGVLPLHASAFVFDGHGVLATGWSKGGKTETLLAFAAHGAQYVGDEWVYVLPDGTMVGVPEPIRLWHWHLRQLPHVWSRLSLATRARLSALDATASWSGRLAVRLPAASPAASVLRRAEPVLRRQAYRQVPPRELFGAGGTTPSAPLEAVFLVTSHDRDQVLVEPVAGQVVADMMRASLLEERAAFLAHYRQFRFAFPGQRSPAVEQAEAREAALLERVFAGRPAYRLGHPYPFDLESLVAPVSAALGRLTEAEPPAPITPGGQP